MIFLPSKINVGFQNRNDTYTKKLAYIIYYDEKGKLRKETSWNNWRDKNIPNEVFDNVPIEGFVLNKKVGDYSDRWGGRQAYTRIYDPRGFEFEIDINNLLYILENTSCIKGKGLEGEFVYGWDGKDLILIPTSSPDYKDLMQHSNLLKENKKFKGKDLKIGATYLTKDNLEMVYLGRFDIYKKVWNYNTKEYDIKNKGKRYWFGCRDKSWNNEIYNRIESLSSLNKIIDVVDESTNKDYAILFEMMESDFEYSPYDETKDEYEDFDIEYIKKRLDYEKHYNDGFECYDRNKTLHYLELSNNNTIVDIIKPKIYYMLEDCKIDTGLTLEEYIEKYGIGNINKYLKNGKFYRKELYVYE